MVADDQYTKDPDVLYMRRNEELLEYMKVHGRMDPKQIVSIGRIVDGPIGQADGKGLSRYNFTTLPDNPYDAADIIHKTYRKLISQGERKTNDIRMTLEVLAICGEEALGNAYGMAYSTLDNAVTDLYKSINLLPEDSDRKLSEDLLAIPELWDVHKKAFAEFLERYMVLAETMLKECPEYAESIPKEKLANAFMQVPVVTVRQINDREFLPSDVIINEVDSKEEKLDTRRD